MPLSIPQSREKLSDMRRPLITAAIALSLIAVGCGSSDSATDESTTTTAAATSTSAATTAAPGTTTTTTAAPATTSAAPTTTTTAGPTTTTLAGEPVDFGPQAGDVLMVFGVAHDDVLNVREGPGIAAAVVAELDPLENDVAALGNTRQLPQSFWYEVEAVGTTGWASARFLFYEGTVDDLTSLVVDRLGGTIPTADSMEELGLIVAEALASTDPPSQIVMSVAPTTGDLGEVTYDIGGLGDDSQWGWRAHVFGTPGDDGSFGLKSVEATSVCARGVTETGLCT